MSKWRYGLVAVAMVAGAQQKPVNFYSVDKEIELGTRLASELASQMTPLNNLAATAYLDRVTGELAAQIPASPFRYVVTVVKDDLRTQPVVLPGGFIYVPSGMFAAAQSESEFAGLLARAMADVAQRAETRQRTREEITQIATLPLISMDGWQGDAVRKGLGVSIPLGMQVFKRKLTMESDALAVKTMAAAGYSPPDLAGYVERTAKDDGRAAAIREAAAQSTVAPHGDGAEFVRLREALAH
jgi:predicted Zn-dependent protease